MRTKLLGVITYYIKTLLLQNHFCNFNKNKNVIYTVKNMQCIYTFDYFIPEILKSVSRDPLPCRVNLEPSNTPEHANQCLQDH